MFPLTVPWSLERRREMMRPGQSKNSAPGVLTLQQSFDLGGNLRFV